MSAILFEWRFSMTQTANGGPSKDRRRHARTKVQEDLVGTLVLELK